MTMPVMEPDLDAAVLRDWARAIDDGPFASLCWGERMAFDNPETLTLMGALAAWTDRVRLVTTVIVPQLHDPVMLAKAGIVLPGTTITGGQPMRTALVLAAAAAAIAIAPTAHADPGCFEVRAPATRGRRTLERDRAEVDS